MRHSTANNLMFTFIMLLSFPLPALAIPAITCHCFTDRTFNPTQPALADPYFLATTQNSFIAAVFNIDKKSIVMKKQQGTSPDDLWIAYWVASQANRSAEALLQAKQDKDSWRDIIAPLRIPPKAMGMRFSNALNAKSPPPLLAEAVVDELFLRYQLLTNTELSALRKAGATNQELIIATVIAVKLRQPARQIYQDIKAGGKTWGSLLQEARIDTKNMPREVVATLKLQPL